MSYYTDRYHSDADFREKEKKRSSEYYKNRYHNDPEFREKQKDRVAGWVYANPDRSRLYARRSYYKKQAFNAGKTNNIDKMVSYTKQYLEVDEIIKKIR